jgi:hypothetical protein
MLISVLRWWDDLYESLAITQVLSRLLGAKNVSFISLESFPVMLAELVHDGN